MQRSDINADASLAVLHSLTNEGRLSEKALCSRWYETIQW